MRHRIDIFSFYFCSPRATNIFANTFALEEWLAPRLAGNRMTANCVDFCRYVNRRPLPLIRHLHRNRHHRLRRALRKRLALTKLRGRGKWQNTKSRTHGKSINRKKTNQRQNREKKPRLNRCIKTKTNTTRPSSK